MTASRKSTRRWLIIVPILLGLGVGLIYVYSGLAKDTEVLGNFEQEAVRLTESISSRTDELDRVETTYNRELAGYAADLRELEKRIEELEKTRSDSEREVAANRRLHEHHVQVLKLQEAELEKGKVILAEAIKHHDEAVLLLANERTENTKLENLVAETRYTLDDLAGVYGAVFRDNEELIVLNRVLIDRVKRKTLAAALGGEKAVSDADLAKMERALGNAEFAKRRADRISREKGFPPRQTP